MIFNKPFLKIIFIRNAGGIRNEAHISSSSVHVLYHVICVIVEN